VRGGVLVFLYYLLVGAFPLMFLGYHYPTDIIASLREAGLALSRNTQRVI
jgi:hypothetical protein